MARILLGVSGGIAAYKAVELTRLAIRSGHAVRVLATPSLQRFVGHATFEGITGAKVLVGEFDADPLRGAFPGELPESHLPIEHLELARRADAMLIAPATANTIARLAAGHCDSALTTAFCACEAPRLIAPAMNDRMLADPATRENLETLTRRGVTVIEPGVGELASAGEHGAGRLAEPPDLLERVEEALGQGGSLRGKRVLVTAGGTREPLDPVRYVGNRSSGRMGLALARAARERGARVTLIAANVALEPPAGVEVVPVVTAEELAEACRAEFPACDLLVMAAAPADFRPGSTAGEKIPRSSGDLQIVLEPTEDVLAGLTAERRDDQVVVGFAAETGAGGKDRARSKLERKGADMIVLNDVADPGIGFESADNAVTLVTAGGETEIPKAAKPEIARAILDRIEPLIESRAGL